MATFATDTFTDTAGTDLTAHTADDAGTWTEHASDTGGQVVITDANRIRGNAAGSTIYYHSGSPASAEYDVQADWFVVTSPAVLHEAIIGRTSTSQVDGYIVRYNTSGQWQLAKYVNNVLTSLGTFAQSLSTSTTYVVKLEIRDATKKVYIDGVERISSTDNAITAAGKAGVRFFNRVASNTTDRHLDNFSATDAGGASTQTITPGFIAAGSQLFAPGLTLTVLPDFLASTAQLFAPTLTVGSVTITPGLLGPGTQVFTPALSGGDVADTTRLIPLIPTHPTEGRCE